MRTGARRALSAVALLQPLSVAGPSSSVYWSSNPNLPGDTVTVSGSFTGQEALHLCPSATGGLLGPAAEGWEAGCQAVTGADIWNHSVKFVLPPAPPQPAWLHVSPKGGPGSTLVVPINAPD
eukprot:COSAG04_NODE_15934_length_515_cov_0.995192_1_plen_121_part_01